MILSPVLHFHLHLNVLLAGIAVVTSQPSTRVAYYLHTAPSKWNEASHMCHSYGANLISFARYNDTKNSVLYVDNNSWNNQLNTLENGFWTGLYRNSSGSLRWQECSDHSGNEVPSSQPSCFVSQADFRLSPLICNSPRPYICQREDGQCWFQPYVDMVIEDSDKGTSHVNKSVEADEGECAKRCRSKMEKERECWGFTFTGDVCMLQFSQEPHRYALHNNNAYFRRQQDSTAYVKICTGGWKTSLEPEVSDDSSMAEDENCTDTSSQEWDDMVCYCECDQPPVILEAESLIMTIDEKVEKIVKELKVNPTNTSSTRRTKVSIEDPRPSAQSIGYFGVAFLVFVFGGIFLLDLNVLFAQVFELCAKLKAKNTKP